MRVHTWSVRSRSVCHALDSGDRAEPIGGQLSPSGHHSVHREPLGHRKLDEPSPQPLAHGPEGRQDILDLRHRPGALPVGLERELPDLQTGRREHPLGSGHVGVPAVLGHVRPRAADPGESHQLGSPRVRLERGSDVRQGTASDHDERQRVIGARRSDDRLRGLRTPRVDVEGAVAPDGVDLADVGIAVGSGLEVDGDGARVEITRLARPTVARTQGPSFGHLDGAPAPVRAANLTARLIPYHRWAQDGPTAMRVFLPTGAPPQE